LTDKVGMCRRRWHCTKENIIPFTILIEET